MMGHNIFVLRNKENYLKIIPTHIKPYLEFCDMHELLKIAPANTHE